MASFKSTDAAGNTYDVEMTKTGSDSGTVRVKHWKKGTAKISGDDTTQLYKIRVATAGTRLKSRARVFGPDPEVTFDFTPSAATITVVGAIIGNSVRVFPLAGQQHADIAKFIDECGFPAE